MAVPSREELVYMAKLTEQAESYEEMVEFMEKVAELTTEEPNLLSVAYKNRRAASTSNASKRSRDYKAKIESELSVIYDGILKLLESTLIPSAASEESKVFYLKMKGDYYRYLAEFKTGEERDAAADNTLAAYDSAQEKAKGLASTHPIRLGLALNFSVFYYEILESPDRAYNLAKLKVISVVFVSMCVLIRLLMRPLLGEESYKDSTLIMQLQFLRDNLIVWTSDMQDESAEEIKEAAASPKLTEEQK
ncbi:hypothetical protein Bca52824_020145 [Brassica carinata]|uniref:14-3-3 domain-containing protein n=1 Tax=Brassica carinata TaxID=52824 RepID=A0A8X7VUB6_BRACI|nr:hypothetical protein Bca52824_020145 [Brassica carinata]